MTTKQFLEGTDVAAKRLLNINLGDHVDKTREFLERLLHADGEVEISEWAVREGKVYVTFNSLVEIEHAPESEQYLQTTLVALFPHCRISGTSLEIESTELL